MLPLTLGINGDHYRSVATHRRKGGKGTLLLPAGGPLVRRRSRLARPSGSRCWRPAGRDSITPDYRNAISRQIV